MYRERIVSDLLKPFLPSRLAVGTGFIITHQNKQSTQCDLIIYDKENTPVIENGDQRFFPVECVIGVVEVKNISSILEVTYLHHKFPGYNALLAFRMFGMGRVLLGK